MLAEFMLKMAARPLIPSLPIEFPLARAKFKLCRERRNHYSERFKTRFRMPALYDSRRWSNCLVRRNITEEGSRRLQSGEIPRLPVPFLNLILLFLTPIRVGFCIDELEPLVKISIIVAIVPGCGPIAAILLTDLHPMYIKIVTV